MINEKQLNPYLEFRFLLQPRTRLVLLPTLLPFIT